MTKITNSYSTNFNYTKTLINKQKAPSQIEASVTVKKLGGPITLEEKKQAEALVHDLGKYHAAVHTNPNQNLAGILLALTISKKNFLDNNPNFTIENWNITCK